jgi:hypothetical protein
VVVVVDVVSAGAVLFGLGDFRLLRAAMIPIIITLSNIAL